MAGNGERLMRQVVRHLPRLGNGPGIVAVSGGPDSVALACILARLQARNQVGPLILAHLNHQLRGDESDADEAFVATLTKKLQQERVDVSCRIQRADVAALAKAGRHNLEAFSRQLRYDWLVQVAQEEGASWIATGHTADDQAETVLHHLLRGTGLAGLRGIAPRRRIADGVVLVRPLLKTARADVLAFLEEIKQPFCRDSSNLDRRFTRNRIRHELMPLLEKEFNPALPQVLGRLAEHASELHRDVRARAKKLLAQAELPRAGDTLVFSRSKLAKSSPYLVRETFRLAWKREGWTTAHMTYDDWCRLAGLVRGIETAVDLPGKVQARQTGRVVQIAKTK